MKRLIRKIKWWWQTAFKGYNECDLWSLDYYLVREIRPALKDFIKMYKRKGCGCPDELFDTENKDNQCHKWLTVLKKMEKAFDLMYYDDFDKPYDMIKENEKEIEEGLALFAKYFRHLWD